MRLFGGDKRDLDSALCASIARCLESHEQAPGVTRGRGTTHSINVAGTSHRSDLIARIAERFLEGMYAPACLLRDPANEHDPNAVKVFVDGYHVGYLKRADAERWQPCLAECERHGVVLCARASFYGPSRWGVELHVKREPPLVESGTSDAELNRITATRLSGMAKKYSLKVSKRGDEYQLLVGKPYRHGARPPLTGWENRVFTLAELEGFLTSAEDAYAAEHGFEADL